MFPSVEDFFRATTFLGVRCERPICFSGLGWRNWKSGSHPWLICQLARAPGSVDPAANTIHWLQFVTTNTAPFATGGASGTVGVDQVPGSTSPFYDVSGGTADSGGLFDLPRRNVRNDLISWQADTFLVQQTGANFVVWQGIEWGWVTRSAVPNVHAVESNTGPVAGDHSITAVYTGDGTFNSQSTDPSNLTVNPYAFTYTVNNDSQTYGTAANLAGDLPATIDTGVNGENLAITYTSAGDTNTASVGTYDIDGTLSDGTGSASNYNVTLVNGTLTVNPYALTYTVYDDSQTYGSPADSASYAEVAREADWHMCL